MATRCNPVQGTSHLARPMRNPSFGQKFPRKERTIPVSCRSKNGPLKSSKPLFVERASGKEIDPLRLERDNAFEKEFSCEFKTNLNDGQDNSILARIMPSLASSSIDEPRVYIYIYIPAPSYPLRGKKLNSFSLLFCCTRIPRSVCLDMDNPLEKTDVQDGR